MFTYFPDNYVWNLSVNISIGIGGQMGEIDQMCRPLIEVSKNGDDAGTMMFLEAWDAMATKLAGQADEDIANKHFLSAGAKLKRAANYLIVAERMQANGYAKRQELYLRMLDYFNRGVSLSGESCERIEIPYEGKTIVGYLTLPANSSGPVPLLIHVNGLDSCKEMLYFFGSAQALARRGVASLCIDQPGTGEALRLAGFKAIYNSEKWAAAVIDYLETRSDIVDPKRIGMWGISLGGYYCPRAVAMEPRLALGAVFGANHNWFEVQQRRLRREGDRPVPHYWEHVRWVWGGETIDDFMKIAENVQLNGVLQNVKVPFLVTHGCNDRQIPLEYAHQTFDQLTNSPKKLLKIFDQATGGVEHAGADNMSYGVDFIADWVTDTFRELAGSR